MPEKGGRKREGPRQQDAWQSHANYYVGFLMDETKKPEELYPELPQIHLAVNRVQAEEVGTRFHPGMIVVKFRQVSGGFAETYLPKLLSGEYGKKDLRALEEAVSLVKEGKVEYPVALNQLESMLGQARTRLLAAKE